MDRAHQPDASRGSHDFSHETSDVSARGIAIFAVGLALLLTASVLGIYGFLTLLSGRRAEVDVPTSPLASRKIPPEPRLQVNPPGDLKELRAAENRVLSSYGWVDPGAGLVRIPIDRAKKLLAERGLPERAEKGPVSAPNGK